MNKLIAVSGIALSLIGASFSEARSIRMDAYQAQIVDADVHPAHAERLGPALNGHVTLNASRNSVILTTYQHVPCNPGRMCLAYMPAPQSIELPLVKRVRTSCGSTLFIGARDARPADGIFEEIRVVDHSTRTCKDLPKYRTEITFRTVTPGWGAPVVDALSRFGGDALQPVFGR